MPEITQNNKVKIMIVGAGGKSAQAITRLLVAETNYAITLVSRSQHQEYHHTAIEVHQADLTDRKVIRELCLRVRPDFIVNTAAITDVDYCEEHKQEAWTVNVRGVENLVRMCRICDAHLLHLSSDYIFDGVAGPYSELDVPKPLSYYGKTKLASENVCVSGSIDFAIIRTNVLYGATAQMSQDFVIWVLNKLKENSPFRVVDDQFNNPTLIDDLALAVLKIIEKRRRGIYNVGGADWLHRLDFAQRIAKVFQYDPDLITSMSSDELSQKAPRPLRAGLITLKAETDLGIRFSGVENGLYAMRRQLQMLGYHDWKL